MKLRQPAAAIILMFASLPASPQLYAEGKCLNLGYATFSTPLQAVLIKNFSRALTEADICHILTEYPPKSLVNKLINGHVDGDALRVKAFQSEVEGYAIRINEALISGAVMMVGKGAAIKTLAEAKSGVVGILRGAVWSAKLTEDFNKVAEGDSYPQLMKLLQKERLSAVLIDADSWGRLQPQYPEMTEHVIRDESVYPYISVHRQEMSEPIAQAIRAYKAKGKTFLDP